MVKQSTKDGYCRLKMIDKDGSADYSGVEKVVLDCMERNILVASNPVMDKLNIDELNGSEMIRLYNIAGQMVLGWSRKRQKG